MGSFSRSNPSRREFWQGKHRFEHWYRDNQVYLITARTRGGEPAFDAERAREVFWDRFAHYAALHGFEAWVVSLLVNHYHAVGYLRVGVELKEMMRKLHGSVAKLVNDQLDVRLVPFWGEGENRDYFDGCLRDETQLIRSYRYVLRQSVRHGVVPRLAGISAHARVPELGGIRRVCARASGADVRGALCAVREAPGA